MCLNDLEVNLDNLDSILSAITTPINVSFNYRKCMFLFVSFYNNYNW